MSDSTVIKEFLVALGFRVDDAKLKKFTQGIDQATRFVGKLGVGVELMAAAVETAVVKVSTNFENLYYASKRIGDTVEDIRGFAFAMGQVGSTGKAGLQAMENVAEFLRSYPGGGRFLQGLGVDLNYVNGQAQVTSQTMEQLATTFRNMPYARAKVYAGVLGIDPNTLQAMLRGTTEAQKRFHDLAARMGVDQDKAAEASKDFMNDMRDVLAMLELMFDKIILKVQPVAKRIVDGLRSLDEATGGWSTTLIALGAVLGPILLMLDPLLALVVGLSVAIGLLWTNFQEWKSGSKSIIDWGEWGPDLENSIKAIKDLGSSFKELLKAAAAFKDLLSDKQWDTFGHGIIRTLNDILHIFSDLIRVVADLLNMDFKKMGHDLMQVWRDGLDKPFDGKNDRQAQGGGPAPAGAGPRTSGPLGLRNNNPGNLRRWGNTPVVGGFAQFETPLAGLTAMAKNLEHYAARGLDTVSSIINTWAPASDHNDTAAYIRDVARQIGVDANKHLNLKDPQTLIRLMTAITKHENGGQMPYGNALMSGAASTALGRPVAVSQTTNIHVTGGDPHATARAVAGEQARVNDALARNLRVVAS